jgi:hypothetical protein
MTATYRDHLDLTGVPASVAEPMRHSIALASHLGGSLGAQANSAFVDGVQAALLVAAGVVATTAVVVAALLGHRSGQPADSTDD